MKSEILSEDVVDREYPYLGILNEGPLVVLFVESDCGTVLTEYEKYSIGEVLTGWDESMFTKFNGVIKIYNG